MTIRAKVAQDTEEDLSYAVPLKGIESDLEIYINRSLETMESSSTTGLCCYVYTHILHILIHLGTITNPAQQPHDGDTLHPTGGVITYQGQGNRRCLIIC